MDLPVSTVGGAPALLALNPLACGKRERLACDAESVKSGLGWIEAASFAAFLCLEGAGIDAFNVSRYR
jgi:hypothetical protein